MSRWPARGRRDEQRLRASRFRVIYLKQPVERFESIDAIDAIAKAFVVHRLRLMQALPFITELKLPGVERVGLIVDADPTDREELEKVRSRDFQRRLHGQGVAHLQDLGLQIGDHNEPLPFFALSGREVGITLTSLGIALAHLESAHVPTVLVIDLAASFLPDHILNGYARLLTEARFGFQTIMVSHSERPKVNWTGWSVARLEGGPPNVRITQQTIKPE